MAPKNICLLLVIASLSLTASASYVAGEEAIVDKYTISPAPALKLPATTPATPLYKETAPPPPPPAPVVKPPTVAPPEAKPPTPYPPVTKPPTPPVVAPAPAPLKPPVVRTIADCIPLCGERCKKHSRQGLCVRACMTCCDRCRCVPPGTYGNKEVCGKCYTDMTTRLNKPKCP